MEEYVILSRKNLQRASGIIKELNIQNHWESINASVNLVGSVKTGLLMKHQDIDFHIYSDSLDISESFKAVSLIARNPAIKEITYLNLTDTEEKCIEWHATYIDSDKQEWQIDMIHILKGSKYDGYFEKVAERISEVLTPELRNRILSLKYETPENIKIPGIAYCEAVIKYQITNYPDLYQWWQKQPKNTINLWMPD